MCQRLVQLATQVLRLLAFWKLEVLIPMVYNS